MKILITGSTGLLGQALSSRLAAAHEVVGVSRHTPQAPSAGRHTTCDLTDRAAVRAAFDALQPDAVIHAQALSDVDRCEQEPALALQQNADAAARVCEAAAGRGTPVVYVSTDYVFDGAKGAAYDERDAPHPISAYGRSKVEGERRVLAYPEGWVARTSTLFGPARRNFCDYIVERLQQGQSVEAFANQVTSPTYSVDLAEALEAVVLRLRAWPKDLPHVVHVANAGGCSRVVFARRIAELLGASQELVHPIPMAQQQRPAKRPPHSALATVVLERVTGRSMRGWDEALHAYLCQRRWLG